LVAANVTNPRISYGDANYNFSAVWSDWNNAGLFIHQSEDLGAISVIDVEACLYICYNDVTFQGVQGVCPYAGLEDAE
jgi:hypothetical protein